MYYLCSYNFVFIDNNDRFYNLIKDETKMINIF